MSDANTNGAAYHDDVAANAERMRADVRAALELGDTASAFDVVVGGIARGLAGHQRTHKLVRELGHAGAEDRGIVIAALARLERKVDTSIDIGTISLEVGQIALARVGAAKDYADREFDVIAAQRAAAQRRRETTSAEDLEAQAVLERRALGGGITINNFDPHASRPDLDAVEVVRAKGDEARKTERTKTAMWVVVAVVSAALSLAGTYHLGQRAGENHHEPTGSAHTQEK